MWGPLSAVPLVFYRESFFRPFLYRDILIQHIPMPQASVLSVFWLKTPGRPLGGFLTSRGVVDHGLVPKSPVTRLLGILGSCYRIKSHLKLVFFCPFMHMSPALSSEYCINPFPAMLGITARHAWKGRSSQTETRLGSLERC